MGAGVRGQGAGLRVVEAEGSWVVEDEAGARLGLGSRVLG